MKTTTTMPAVSTYEQSALDFLQTFNVTLAIKRTTDKAPAWDEDNHPVRFDFWGSINDRSLGKDPSAYDVLACISGDINTPDTFQEFCDEMGYDTDSRSALATFKRCNKFGQALRAFFTNPDERDALSEIN
jgi:hypothetical protein